MPPQLYERVDKWTHKPQSILNHKKQLSTAFTILAFIKSENYKNTFTLQS
jgi:hypothetical protein